MKLLFVDSCISQRGSASRTAALAAAFLETVRSRHSDWVTETVSQETLLNLKPFSARALDERDALIRSGRLDASLFALARQFQAADGIVVAAPFWDLSYPAALRTYIEHISVVGLTYHYEADGCHGDCRGKWLIYLTTGGDFERADSVGVLHWRQLCALFGIPRFDAVFAGGMDADPAQAQALLADGCARARKLAEEL